VFFRDVQIEVVYKIYTNIFKWFTTAFRRLGKIAKSDC